MTELKPCPFCGSMELAIHNTFDRDFLFYVCCHNCGGRGGKEQDSDKAIERWNRRVEE